MNGSRTHTTSLLRPHTQSLDHDASVPLGRLPPHVSLSFAVNSFVQLLVVVLHGVQVSQVTHTQRDGDQAERHHWFIRSDEELRVHSSEQCGGGGSSQSGAPVAFVRAGTRLLFSGLWVRHVLQTDTHSYVDKPKELKTNGQ